MFKDPIYKEGYIAGYWDGVKDTVSGKVSNCCASEIERMPIKAMTLSSRANNCLSRCGCTVVGDVIALNSETIGRMRNLGAKTAAEIARWLIEHDILCSAWWEYN